MYCVKSVPIRSYSGPYFPAFGLNMERYSVSRCIQSEIRKIRTRIAPNTDTFYAVLGHYSTKKSASLVRFFGHFFLQTYKLEI